MARTSEEHRDPVTDSGTVLFVPRGTMASFVGLPCSNSTGKGASLFSSGDALTLKLRTVLRSGAC